MCCFRLSMSRVPTPSVSTRIRCVPPTCLKSYANVRFTDDAPSWTCLFRQLWTVLFACSGIKCFLEFTAHWFQISMSHVPTPSLSLRIWCVMCGTKVEAESHNYHFTWKVWYKGGGRVPYPSFLFEKCGERMEAESNNYHSYSKSVVEGWRWRAISVIFARKVW